MSEPEAEAALEMARAIRPYLRELVADSDAVDRELAAALADAGADRVRAELRRRPKTRRWTDAFRRHGVPADLVPPKQRSGAAPPGKGDIVQARRFRCPEANDYVWYRRTASSPIPLCPTHGVRLAPDVQT